MSADRLLSAGDGAYTRETVCTPEMVRIALHIKRTKWKTERHKFAWSYLLGPRSARIAWGAVLDTLATTNEDALASRRRRSA